MINTNQNNAVSGRSILGSAAKFLNKSEPTFTYLEFRSFTDFIEAVVLFDNLYIVGDFNDRESKAKSLMDKLNSCNEEKFIFNIDNEKGDFVLNDHNIDEFIKNRIDSVFSGELSFIRKQTIPSKPTNRYTDDEKSNFLDQISKVVEGENVEANIKEIILKLHRGNTNSEYIKHLLRAFEIAAVTTAVNGSSIFTGSRKPIGFLITSNCQETNLKSETHKVYSYANNLFINRQNGNTNFPFYIPLLTAIFFQNYDESKEFVENVIELRQQFSIFRKKHCPITTNSKKKVDKRIKELDNIEKYFNEIFRLSSSSNWANTFHKYKNELLFDEKMVKSSINARFDTQNKSLDIDSPSASLNLITFVKNLIKFFFDFFRNLKISSKCTPLPNEFVRLINKSDIEDPKNIFRINEFQETKMKTIDNFLRNQNVL